MEIKISIGGPGTGEIGGAAIGSNQTYHRTKDSMISKNEGREFLI